MKKKMTFMTSDVVIGAIYIFPMRDNIFSSATNHLITDKIPLLPFKFLSIHLWFLHDHIWQLFWQ